VKTRLIEADENMGPQLAFQCEGCGQAHVVPVEAGDPKAWTWNGDQDRPVLSPSIKVVAPHANGTHVCHSFVGCNGAQPGEIIFLSDSTHRLAGQVRPLIEWRFDDEPI